CFREDLVCLSERRSLVFEITARQRGFTGPQRHRQRSNQPLLQQPDTANTALVEEFPVIRQLRWLRYGQLLSKGMQYAHKGLSIGRTFRAVAGEVDVNASPA